MGQRLLAPPAWSGRACAGLILSFGILAVAAGLAIKEFSFDPSAIRIAGAVLLLLLGVASLVPAAQNLGSRLLAPLASRASAAAAHGNQTGLAGNFLVGALLGAIWSPCAGPTLGAALSLVTQAATLFQGWILILIFGIGASLPLLVLAYGSRSFFQANRRRLIMLAGRAKPVFGVILILVAAGILSGWDKPLEAVVLRQLPDSWVDLTTRY